MPGATIATCRQHLQAIGRARKAYQRAHHGGLPAHLSALYPSYLKDKATLHCPADASPGTPSSFGGALADPHMPVSYLYGHQDSASEWLHRADQQMVGQPAPDFTLSDAAGQTASLRERKSTIAGRTR